MASESKEPEGGLRAGAADEFAMKQGDASALVDAALAAPALPDLGAEVERLLAAEKAARAASDTSSASRAARAAAAACWRARDLARLGGVLTVLARRRGGGGGGAGGAGGGGGAAGTVLADTVRAAMGYLDEAEAAGFTRADRLALLATLRTVTDGKVRGRALCRRRSPSCARGLFIARPRSPRPRRYTSRSSARG